MAESPREAGLIVERGTDEQGEALYGFVHQTFQEYLAAVDVYERYLGGEDASISRRPQTSPARSMKPRMLQPQTGRSY